MGPGFPAPEEILLASVRAMGSGARQAFPFESVASYYRSVLERSFPISASPASFDELRRKGFAEIPGRESDRVSGFSWKGFAGSAGNREKTQQDRQDPFALRVSHAGSGEPLFTVGGGD